MNAGSCCKRSMGDDDELHVICHVYAMMDTGNKIIELLTKNWKL